MIFWIERGRRRRGLCRCEIVDALYLTLVDHTRSFGLGAQIRQQATREGKIKVSGENETVVGTGFEGVVEVWMKLF